MVLLRHCKSSQSMKDFPAGRRFIGVRHCILSTIRELQRVLSKDGSLCLMQENAEYRINPGIHYERMVADDDKPRKPDQTGEAGL